MQNGHIMCLVCIGKYKQATCPVCRARKRKRIVLTRTNKVHLVSSVKLSLILLLSLAGWSLTTDMANNKISKLRIEAEQREIDHRLEVDALNQRLHDLEKRYHSFFTPFPFVVPSFDLFEPVPFMDSEPVCPALPKEEEKNSRALLQEIIDALEE